jgi:hypothetical protein
LEGKRRREGNREKRTGREAEMRRQQLENGDERDRRKDIGRKGR